MLSLFFINVFSEEIRISMLAGSDGEQTPTTRVMDAAVLRSLARTTRNRWHPVSGYDHCVCLSEGGDTDCLQVAESGRAARPGAAAS